MKIVFDTGGTKTRVAGTKDLEVFSEPVVFETPKDFDAYLEAFHDAVETVLGGEAIEEVAGDFAGPFAEDRSVLTSMPSIPEWGRNIPVRQKLEASLETDVSVMNDAALVGLGEAVFGAGRGKSIVVYVTVSTGVGGAKISDGMVDKRVYGFEPGWQVIDTDGTLRPEDNKKGFLIDFISGRAVERETEKKPYEITDSAYWDKMAKYLATGLNNTILHWSPHIVVLGGSMMNEVGIQIPDVKRHLAELMKIYPNPPEIVHSELGDFGGLYGGMAFLKKNAENSV